MSDPIQPIPASDPNKCTDSERTKQVTSVTWTVSVVAVVAGVALINEPIWPVAFGIAAIAVMAAFVCSCILKRV